MNRICPLDGSTLEVKGTMGKLEQLEWKQVLVVRRCPHCGEVTFWDDYEDLMSIKGKKQQRLTVTADD